MSHYDKLDELIVAAVSARRNPLYDRHCTEEARRLEAATAREAFRITDGRLQALRKRGVIVHLTKAEGGGSGGWKIAAAIRSSGEAECSSGADAGSAGE